jgi:hypothetical protein
MEEKKELKIGDRILMINAFSKNVLEVKRITKTFAEAVNIQAPNHKEKFKLELLGGQPQIKKSERFDTTEYRLWNEKK